MRLRAHQPPTVEPVPRRLGVIILNYRQPDLTIDCLSSLNGEVEVGSDLVVVVENGSGDDSAERIEAAIRKKRWSGWARLLRCSPNRGFAGGNNFGIRSVSARWYLLLNNDTVVRPGAIATLLAAIKARPEVGLIGPSMENRAGLHTTSCFRTVHPVTEFLGAAKTGPLTKLLRRYDTCIAPSPTPIDVDWIGFACVLIRREVFEQIGLLDPGYYLYFDDNDFCRRASDAGWRIVYRPEARIVHYVGETTQVTTHERARDRRPRYFYESRARYFAKFYGTSGLWLANILWTLGRAVSLLREILGTKRPHTCAHEARDTWINSLRPLRSSSGRAARKDTWLETAFVNDSAAATPEGGSRQIGMSP